MTMKTKNDRLFELRKTIAECVLKSSQLRQKMESLLIGIGRNANIADLNIEVSAMADRQMNEMLAEFNLAMAEFQVNELEKTNTIVELFREQLKIQMS